MVDLLDRPYWVNWIRWHLYHRHKRRKAARRRAAWEFINRIRAMPPGSLVIDGGANVGKVTEAFLRQGFEVHAFEPDPMAREIFAARFGSDPRVHLHPAALGAHAGRMKLYRRKDFTELQIEATVGSSLVPNDSHDLDFAIDVEVVDFAEFLTSLGRPVDLVKLDIEGAEVELLERVLAEGLYKKIGMIYAETHERLYDGAIAERTAGLRREVSARGIENINLDWS